MFWDGSYMFWLRNKEIFFLCYAPLAKVLMSKGCQLSCLLFWCSLALDFSHDKTIAKLVGNAVLGFVLSYKCKHFIHSNQHDAHTFVILHIYFTITKTTTTTTITAQRRRADNIGIHCNFFPPFWSSIRFSVRSHIFKPWTDLEWETGGPDPPGKSQVVMFPWKYWNGHP